MQKTKWILDSVGWITSDCRTLDKSIQFFEHQFVSLFLKWVGGHNTLTFGLFWWLIDLVPINCWCLTHSRPSIDGNSFLFLFCLLFFFHHGQMSPIHCHSPSNTLIIWFIFAKLETDESWLLYYWQASFKVCCLLLFHQSPGLFPDLGKRREGFLFFFFKAID